MKFTMEIDPEDNPSAVGEFLRSSFFANKKRWDGQPNDWSIGCYTTLDWQEDVEPLEPLPVDQSFRAPEETTLKWARGQKDDIECRWYWDGDGTLAFRLPDGKWLVNYDCKKDHDWKIVYSADEL